VPVHDCKPAPTPGLPTHVPSTPATVGHLLHYIVRSIVQASLARGVILVPSSAGKGEKDEMPDWIRHAIWWQVYPLGFVGAERELQPNRPIVHRLPQLFDWLEYAVDLGANGLALGPIFAAETHGYDTVDHFRIDPRLGDDGDFDALVAAAHDRGLRVLLDGVFNHVGRGHPAFQRALAEGPTAPTASWFRLAWPERWSPATEPRHADFEGHRHLVALNHDELAVADYVAEVMRHWLRRGADGWRLDAAYAVPSGFWARVLPGIRAEHPDVYVVGEIIHGDYVAAAREGTLDSVTQYELWKAIWSALNDRNFFELAWALGRHNGYLDAFAPLTFVGNHDVTRIASQLLDERYLPHALAILFTVGGTPAIYAGDEQAFRGIKEQRAGGDDAIRPAFPDTPAGLAEYGWGVYRLHQQVVGLRRRHPWLHRAHTEVATLRSEALAYVVRGDGESLTVALSVADQPTTLDVPGAVSIALGDGTLRGAGPEARLSLPPHGWAILDGA
jgi:cyclomaltodextrinase